MNTLRCPVGHASADPPAEVALVDCAQSVACSR
jgi:hypothetical protein